MSLLNILSGFKVLEEVDSPINGHLRVIKDISWGVHIEGGGLTQSGGVAERVWRTSLNRVSNSGLMVRKALIVGLGGGSIAKIISENWPEASIIGVDIDPVIVELGKKYLGLSDKKVDIIIKDAYDFVVAHKAPITNHNYDLICIDTYVGDKFPDKFESEEFIKNIKELLEPGGMVVFNRLYYGEKRPLALSFEKKLEKLFDITRVFAEANIMFICS
jgi:spermidine synthase